MKRAFFLDRDGVINKNCPGYVRKPEQFELIPGVAKAIKMINESGWLVVVVTNQSMVAQGLASIEDLEAIHKRMEKLLEEAGASLDGIYYCPHPKPGGCGCRKPEPGMLFQAAEDFDIDVSVSYTHLRAHET